MARQVEIRQARPDERQAVLDVANASFGRPDKPFDFARLLPYCFTPQRMPDHWLYVEDGRILGVVGAYPFTVWLNGVAFRTIGVGQVCTLPEVRGRGIMSELLKVVTARMDQACDFAWLWGDRRRYGRYGWAVGGVTTVFEANEKYLPEPPPAEEVRRLDKQADADRMYRAAIAQPYAVDYTREEFDLLLEASEVSGWTWRDAWAICRPFPRVVAAGGPEDQVAALLSHLVRIGKQKDPPQEKVIFEAGPFDSVLMRVAKSHYAQVTRRPSASFRVCNLLGYFIKAAQAVRQVPAGQASLSLRNTDNGQTVRLSCRDGRYIVDADIDANVVAASTAELSEALFGPLPLETTLPAVAPDSPLRPLLSLPIHISYLWTL